MGTVVKHPVPDRVKPSSVIFDIRALWRSRLSVRVPGCQKLQMTAQHSLARVGVKGLTSPRALLLWTVMSVCSSVDDAEFSWSPGPYFISIGSVRRRSVRSVRSITANQFKGIIAGQLCQTLLSRLLSAKIAK